MGLCSRRDFDYIEIMNVNTPPVLRPVETHTGILPVIVGRWSSRAINPHRTVDPAVLNRLFEAARWAPSAANNQPWRFLSFGPEDTEALETARSALSAGNAWALAAPRLLFVLTRTDRPGSGNANIRAHYEAGMAAVQMALQAAQEGLVFHQMAGFSDAKVRENFKVPDNFAVVVAVALGWPGSADSVPESKRGLESAPRERKKLEELVFPNGTVPEE